MSELYYEMNAYKKSKKNLGKSAWYWTLSGSEKSEDKRHVLIPYKAATYYAILRQTMAKQE
jgi:hypothetical protein